MGEKDDEPNKVEVSDLQNGPLTEANRECRDIICCLLFFSLCVVMIYLAAYGYANGNVSGVFRGIDKYGKVCGKDTLVNYPYLYFANPYATLMSDVLQNKICVSSCPTWNGSVVVPVSCSPAADCTYTYTYKSDGTKATGAAIPSGSDVLGYDSSLVADRVCIPNPTLFSSLFSNSTSNSITSMFSSHQANFLSDIQNNYKWLLAAAGLALLIAFIFMFLLRCLAGCIVWVSLFGTVLFLLGLGLIFLYNAGKLNAIASVATYLGVPSINSQYNQPIGWTLISLSGLFLIVVLCCCSRIRLAVAICKSAGQFVVGVCLIVLVPIFQAALAFGLWAGCLVSMAYLVSAAQFKALYTSDYFTSIVKYDDPALIRFYVFVFGTLWINAFFSAMGVFVIASACCMWYYSHAPGSELSLPIWRSYKMLFRYHWGSLAFGSLLVAIVQFLQMVVEFFKRQAEASGTSNKCMQYTIRCIQCCLACVECIIKFINTQAYIQIALRGKNFCYAAKDGFQLVWSNPLRYSIVGGIGGIIMFLGKVAISALTAFLFYLFISYVQSVRQNYLQPFLQVVVVAIIGYLVGMLFMSVYTIAMDTLLQCFIVDETNQKAKGKGKPQWAPEDLANLMDVEEQKQKQESKQKAKE